MPSNDSQRMIEGASATVERPPRASSTCSSPLSCSGSRDRRRAFGKNMFTSHPNLPVSPSPRLPSLPLTPSRLTLVSPFGLRFAQSVSAPASRLGSPRLPLTPSRSRSCRPLGFALLSLSRLPPVASALHVSSSQSLLVSRQSRLSPQSSRYFSSLFSSC